MQYPFYPRLGYPFIPVSNTLLFQLPIPFYPHLGCPFYLSFQVSIHFLSKTDSQLPKPFYPSFRYPFIPVSNTLLSQFLIPFLWQFLIPFYPHFQYTFYTSLGYPIFLPVSATLLYLFLIHFLYLFLFQPFPGPFLPPPPMQLCIHVLCLVPNVRIGHKSE